MAYRRLSSILLIFLLSLLFLPSAEAWGWKTHSDIVELVYQELSPEVREKLDLDIMKNASNDPDEVFKDYTYHSYPKSYQKAQEWLDKGKRAYDKGDYQEASYCYGVASHYISDSFSAPHTVSRESSEDHKAYEDQAKKLTPHILNLTGDLKIQLEKGHQEGGASWRDWLDTRDPGIVQKNLDLAASVTLFAVENSINSNSSPDPLLVIYKYLESLIT